MYYVSAFVVVCCELLSQVRRRRRRRRRGLDNLDFLFLFIVLLAFIDWICLSVKLSYHKRVTD